MQTRILLLSLAALSFTACPEDMSTEKATWDVTTKGWSDRLDKMKKGHEELSGKVKVFTVPENEPTLVADRADLAKAVETANTAITSAEHEMQTAKTTIEKLISNGKRVQLEVALGTTKSTVDGTLARAESLVSSSNSALETLTKKAASAKASGDAAKSRTDAWLNEVKKKGAAIIVDDLVFAAEGVDVEKSRVALTSLLATLKSCADLKVELTVVALGEAADLGTKRAEAIKAHLTTNGVNAAVFAKVSGIAVKEGDEKISFAVTTPCK